MPLIREPRPELERPIPPRIARLPIDARGYPVPWFVAWIEGAPEFRAMDVDKWTRAVRERRCWMCGDTLGRYLSFVIGPMCGVNRTTSEPPCHLECAEWSARNCPFLSRPQARRREDDVVNASCAANAPGFAITRNPGVTLIWTCRRYRVFKSPAGGSANGGRLIELSDPEHVRWYACGRPATREEVEASVESGLPALDAMCDKDSDPAEARRVLARMAARLLPLYPEAIGATTSAR